MPLESATFGRPEVAPAGAPPKSCQRLRDWVPEGLILAGARLRGTARCERFPENAIWNRNGAQKDLCGNGPGPPRGGFGHHCHWPPDSRKSIGPGGFQKSSVSLGVPLFGGPFRDSKHCRNIGVPCPGGGEGDVFPRRCYVSAAHFAASSALCVHAVVRAYMHA